MLRISTVERTYLAKVIYNNIFIVVSNVRSGGIVDQGGVCSPQREFWHLRPGCIPRPMQCRAQTGVILRRGFKCVVRGPRPLSFASRTVGNGSKLVRYERWKWLEIRGHG